MKPATMKLGQLIVIVIAAVSAISAHAVTSINLSNYQVTGNFALDTLNGMGLEASAVTYARDRGSLFFVGDEGLGVVEISRAGQTLSTMTFSGGTNLGWPTTSTNRDAEGLTYLGGGVLVIAEERLQDAFRFTYVAGGSVNLANADFASIGGNAGNLGTEGISYDPRDGSFVSVKQNAPQDILAGSLSFAQGGGTSAMTQLFNPSLLGLSSLSDVQTLSPVDALTGFAAADNLLILSLDSHLLLEVDRNGGILSSFDLAGVTQQAIEGVTVDEFGTIYLVAEDSGFGNSRLITLAAPVPEPEVWGMLMAGLGLLGFVARRRRKAVVQ